MHKLHVKMVDFVKQHQQEHMIAFVLLAILVLTVVKVSYRVLDLNINVFGYYVHVYQNK